MFPIRFREKEKKRKRKKKRKKEKKKKKKKRKKEKKKKRKKEKKKKRKKEKKKKRKKEKKKKRKKEKREKLIVLQKNNTYDCGFFVLGFIEVILQKLQKDGLQYFKAMEQQKDFVADNSIFLFVSCLFVCFYSLLMSSCLFFTNRKIPCPKMNLRERYRQKIKSAFQAQIEKISIDIGLFPFFVFIFPLLFYFSYFCLQKKKRMRRRRRIPRRRRRRKRRGRKIITWIKRGLAKNFRSSSPLHLSLRNSPPIPPPHLHILLTPSCLFNNPTTPFTLLSIFRLQKSLRPLLVFLLI